MRFPYQPELLMHLRSAQRIKTEEPIGPGRKQDALLQKVSTKKDKSCSQWNRCLNAMHSLARNFALVLAIDPVLPVTSDQNST